MILRFQLKKLEGQRSASLLSTDNFFNHLETDINNLFGTAEGRNEATGAGAELRVLEDGVVITTVSYSVPDTGGVPANFEFYTDVPPTAGQHVYELQGRLNGAASASVTYVTLSVMENVL